MATKVGRSRCSSGAWPNGRPLTIPGGTVAALIRLGTAAADSGDYEGAELSLDEALTACDAARARKTPALAAAFGGQPAMAIGWVLYPRGIAAWGQGRTE